ncbi:MAG: DUF2116 family Zn-ribbon domain-containing protein [Promethearchaeota archaeon]
MSSTQKKYAGTKKERVFPHRHCSICFKLIPEFSDGYCSQECRNYKRNRRRGRKGKIMKFILSYGIIIALVAIMFLVFI